MVMRGCVGDAGAGCGVCAIANPAELAAIAAAQRVLSRRRGVLPSPRAPGLPGARIVVRKSGRPDLRWGGVGGGGGAIEARPSRFAPPPSLALPRIAREDARKRADVRGGNRPSKPR